MKTFKLRILTPTGPLYQGDCTSIVIPTSDGMYGVLADHCNVVGAVSTGQMEITYKTDEVRRAAVSSGVFKVEDGNVLLLVESAEWSENIDIARAERAINAAKEMLLSKQSNRAHSAAIADLARALNRLNVASWTRGHS